MRNPCDRKERNIILVVLLLLSLVGTVSGLGAGFVGDPLSSSIPPLEVSFTDLSTGGPTNWVWFFGDEAFEIGVTSSAEWGERYHQESVSLPDGSIVLMGGFDGVDQRNDVWRSSNNGTTWTQVNSSAGWAGRGGFSSVVMADGSIILMGGWTSGGVVNDVWRSTDSGVTWAEINSSAGWSPRMYPDIVAMLDGSIVLMGGIDGTWTATGDVWRSSDDGATWTEVNSSAGWSARYDFSSVSLPDGSIVLMGGDDTSSIRNDVWRSADNGTTWSEVTPAADWPARYGHTSVVLPDGSIVLTSGSDSSYVYLNDVWRSTDGGATWTEMAPSAQWSPRDGHSSAVALDGSVILMGGGSDGHYFSDVWRFMIPGSLEQNPVHTYTDPGSYTVSLQIYNTTGGYDDLSRVEYITVGGVPLVVNFTESPRFGLTTPLEVEFTDLTTSSPLTWNWTFGDLGGSNTSTLQNPTHTYDNAGVFTVNLTATNSWGRHSEVKTAYVRVFETGAWNTLVVDDTSSESVTYNDIAVDSEHRPRIAYQYLDDDRWAYYIKYASFDNGSWTKNTISEVDNTGYGANLVIDQATDTPHISHEVDGEPYTLYYTFYNGTDWNSEIVAYHTYYSPSSNSIQYNGSPIIAYAASDPPGLVYGIKSGGSWSTDTIESPTTYGTGFEPSLVIKPGVTGVAYSRRGRWGGSLLYAEERTGWTVETLPTPIYDTYTVLRSSLDYNSSLVPYIAFYNSSGVFYASRSSGIWNIEEVRVTPGIAAVSLVIDSADTPHIVYSLDELDGEVNGLYHAIKDPEGTSWYSEVIDNSTRAPGKHIAIAADSVNGLHVSYEWDPVEGEISETILKYAYKSPGGALNAAFRANLTSGFVPLAVKFTDLSTGAGGIDGWNWSFGDDTYSELENPEHTYGAGLYTVILNVTSGSSSDTETKVDYINASTHAPVASFTSNVTSGVAPIGVLFTDTSTYDPISWNWSFKDVVGNNTQVWWSTDQDPVITFSEAGNYSIKLEATNGGGSNITSGAHFINVTAFTYPPIANFTGTPLSGSKPLVVQFADTSDNSPTSRLWVFGDMGIGNISIQQNPLHQYNSTGLYTVNLTVSNEAGSDYKVVTNYINVTPSSKVILAGGYSGDMSSGSTYVYRSADTGLTWVRSLSTFLPRGGIGSLVYVGNSTVVGGATDTYDYPRMYKSTDSGRTWVYKQTLYDTTSIEKLVYIGDGKIIGGAGMGYLYESYDYGETWGKTGHVDGYDVSSKITSLTNLGGGVVLAGHYPTGYIYRTPDNGTSWSYLSTPGADTNIASLLYLGDGVVLAGAGPGGNIYKSVNNGTTWSLIQRLGNQDIVYSLEDLGSNIVLAGTYQYTDGAQVYISTDSGDTWSLTERLGSEYSVYSLSNANNGRMVAGNGPNGSVYRSINGGLNWSYVERLGNPSLAYASWVRSLLSFDSPPSANFTNYSGSMRKGYTPFNVKFNDTSEDNPISWLWDFGDSSIDNTSTLQHPEHVYNASGIFNVTLTTTNEFGSNTLIRSNYITVDTSTVADFIGVPPLTGYAPLTVQFNDTSGGLPLTSWLWTFGDMGPGNTSIIQNASYIYTSPGTYTVNMTGSNEGGTFTKVRTGYITILPISANFVGVPTGGALPIEVQFTDTSLGNPDSWLWDFGDMSSSNTSTIQNPTHWYNSTGHFNVTLVANNTYSTDAETKTDYIYTYIPLPPVVDFIGLPRYGGIPLSVQFNVTTAVNTTPLTLWNWSFGDGTVNESKNATHIYTIVGLYSVNLTATNLGGSNSTVKVGYIDVRPAYSGNEIYGWVRNGTSTEVIPGSTVYLTNLMGVSVTNITDALGAYSFSGLPTMMPYALHATKTGWTPDVDGWINSGMETGMTTRQNLSMTIGEGGGNVTGNLTLSLTFRDLSDNSLITQTVGVDTSGSLVGTHYTTTGYLNLTNLTQDSALSASATSSGYQPSGLRTYPMNTSMNDTIYLNKENNNQPVHVYYPHQVRFTTEDPYGMPLSGVFVNVKGYNTTYANSTWWQNIFGLDMSSTNLFETMSGTTASDGSIVFLMSESIYYQIDLSRGSYIQNLTVYPKEDSYLVIMTPGGSLFGTTNSTSDVFYYLSAEEINSTYMALNLNYTDKSHATTDVTFWVDNQTRATRIWSGVYSGNVNSTYYLDITGRHGQSIYYGFFAHHIDAGNVSSMKTFTVRSRLIEIGLDDTSYQWISIILLVLFTALFSGITVRYGYVLVPFMGAFLWYIGWLQTTNLIVVSAIILGVLLYITKTQAISEG